MTHPKPERFFHGAQLDLARAVARTDLPAMQALAPQAHVSVPGDEGMTLLLFAMLSASSLAPAPLAVVTALVRAGADVLAVVPGLGSALDLVLRATSGPEMLRALLDGGVSPDARVGGGEIPALFRAAAADTVANMRLLLDRGADVNARDALGTPALTYALRAMQLDQVSELLDRGADPHVTNRLGQSFGNVLQGLMARQIPDSPALREMTRIRDRIARAGVAWPPAPPSVERERMRERGEKPIVPFGETR